ncbi:hypothetical protein ZIOFF_062742 [Zingiber officinale]|uniref:CCHC-type domain-containing protein n=1 Tax=Zingiber officinale TaxID=94328 RepID=A0A8J5KFL9_ZINOF|nr:hypothetical protein ZIOFF_062742 [Zingiber officinale]
MISLPISADPSFLSILPSRWSDSLSHFATQLSFAGGATADGAQREDGWRRDEEERGKCISRSGIDFVSSVREDLELIYASSVQEDLELILWVLWEILAELLEEVFFVMFDRSNSFDSKFLLVMAGRRNNNNNGEMGGQNNQFLEGLTALLHEQNRIHGEQIQQILQAREQGSTPRRSAPSTQPVYKQFRELGPTEFKGTTDPIAAEGWIRSLETIFDFMQLTDVDKVRCAIFMLRDDARVWWEGAQLTVDLATLTWTDFKEVFYGKYFTVDNRTRLAREFLELRQGDLSVAEYVRRFERGRYFAPMITSQPVEELKHFTEGLRPAIRHDVRLSWVTTFREAVDQALMSERDRNDMIKEAQNKRLSYQGRDQQEPGKKKTIPGQNSGKQPFKQAQPRQQIQKTQAAEGTGFRVENKVRCSKCEKIHAGQCLTGTDVCFMCKKSGHFARECPLLREPTKGRVFAMTQEQVDLDTAIITGQMMDQQLAEWKRRDEEKGQAVYTTMGGVAAPQLTGHNARTGGGETKKKEASVFHGDSLRSVRSGIDFVSSVREDLELIYASSVREDLELILWVLWEILADLLEEVFFVMFDRSNSFDSKFLLVIYTVRTSGGQTVVVNPWNEFFVTFSISAATHWLSYKFKFIPVHKPFHGEDVSPDTVEDLRME